MLISARFQEDCHVLASLWNAADRVVRQIRACLVLQIVIRVLISVSSPPRSRVPISNSLTELHSFQEHY